MKNKQEKAVKANWEYINFILNYNNLEYFIKQMDIMKNFSGSIKQIICIRIASSKS